MSLLKSTHLQCFLRMHTELFPPLPYLFLTLNIIQIKNLWKELNHLHFPLSYLPELVSFLSHGSGFLLLLFFFGLFITVTENFFFHILIYSPFMNDIFIGSIVADQQIFSFSHWKHNATLLLMSKLCLYKLFYFRKKLSFLLLHDLYVFKL